MKNAESAQQAADSELSAAKQIASQKDGEYAKAQKSEADAKAAKEAAGKAVSDAQSALQQANDKLASAKDNYGAAKASADKLKAQYLKGARGFFESMGAQSAVDVLDKAKYASYTKTGSETDATYLANMQATVQYMKKLNELRKANGLNELDVSLELVAAAISDVNWSSTVLVDTRVLQHAQQFNVGENLCTGTENCFRAWYDIEKQNVADFKAELGISADKKDTELSSDELSKIYAKATPSKQVGHYLNIIDSRYGVMGYAISMYGWTLSGTTFDFGNFHPSNDIDFNAHVMTVDEYEEALNSYIDSVDYEKVLAAAQAKVDGANDAANSASAALTAAENDAKTKGDALASAGKATAAAKQAADDARDNVSAKKQSAADAAGAVADAMSALQEAHSSTSQARADADDAGNAFLQAQFAKDQAESDAAAAAAQIEAKQQAVDDAEKAKAGLTAALDAASKELNAKKAAYAPKKQALDASDKALDAAQAAYDAAVQGDADAQAAVVQTGQQKAAADAAVDSMRTAAQSAQQSLDGLMALDAQLKASYNADAQAKADLTEANQQKVDADKAVDAAKAPIADLTAALQAAQANQQLVAGFDVRSQIDAPAALDPAQGPLLGNVKALCDDANVKKQAADAADAQLAAAKAQFDQDSVPYLKALAERDAAYAEYIQASAAYQHAVAEEQERQRQEELAKQEAAKKTIAAESQVTKASYDADSGQHVEKASQSPKTADASNGPIMALVAGTALGGAIAARRKLRSAKHAR